MPDITMCFSEDCPMREKCYRATANPDPIYQSYADFSTYSCNENNGFEDFIKNKSTKWNDSFIGKNSLYIVLRVIVWHNI